MPDIKACLVALAVGLLVGSIYGLLNVRSPAPPIVALIGLLGMLMGEQSVSRARHFWVAKPVPVSTVGTTGGDPVPHVRSVPAKDGD